MTEMHGDGGVDSPGEARLAYHDVLGITRGIERDHESDRGFSLRVARYFDLQRALRGEITAGGITPDTANRRTATLLAGMTTSTREELERSPAPAERDMYRRVLEITNGFEQTHDADLAFSQRREH